VKIQQFRRERFAAVPAFDEIGCRIIGARPKCSRVLDESAEFAKSFVPGSRILKWAKRELIWTSYSEFLDPRL